MLLAEPAAEECTVIATLPAVPFGKLQNGTTATHHFAQKLSEADFVGVPIEERRIVDGTPSQPNADGSEDH